MELIGNGPVQCSSTCQSGIQFRVLSVGGLVLGPRINQVPCLGDAIVGVRVKNTCPSSLQGSFPSLKVRLHQACMNTLLIELSAAKADIVLNTLSITSDSPKAYKSLKDFNKR